MTSKQTLIRLLSGIMMLFMAMEIEAKQSGPSSPSVIQHTNYLHLVFGLCLVIVIFFVVAFLLKKINMSGAPSSSALKVLAGLPLGTKEKIILIEAGKKQILIGVCQGNINTLHVFDEPLIDSQSMKNGIFVEQLKAFMNKGS